MTEPDLRRRPHGPPPRPVSATEAALRRALPWLVGATLIILLAAAAGVGTAHLIADLNAAPSPDVALLPTSSPRPTASSMPSAEPPVDPTATPSGTPTAQPTATLAAEPTPEPTPIVYVVQPGDSVSLIAARFGVTPEAIIELNNLSNPNRILPGQQLLIPAPPASPAP